MSDRSRDRFVVGMLGTVVVSLALVPLWATASGRTLADPSRPGASLGELTRYPGAPEEGANGYPTPTGPRVERVNLPTAHGRAFHLAVYAALRSLGLAPLPAALVVALAVLETGGGASAWCNNVGNLRAGRTWAGPWYRFGGGSPWRAYPTLRAGVRALLGVLQLPRYAEAWQLLQQGRPEWYRALVAAGYSEGDPDEHFADYRSVLEVVRRRVDA